MDEGETRDRFFPDANGEFMKKILANKYLILASRLLLGMVFVVASVDKIAEPAAFAASVQAYRLIPLPAVNLFALLTAWLELLCGIFLVSGVLVRSSALILSALLGIFVVAMLTALARNLEISCGCFGPGHTDQIGWSRIIEDLGLLLLGIHLYHYPIPGFSAENLLVSVRDE